MGFAGQHKAGLRVTTIEFQIRQSRNDVVASDVVPVVFTLEKQRPIGRRGFGAVDLRPRYTRHRAGGYDHRRIDAQFLVDNRFSLTLSDRPELRIDPTGVINTGAMSGVSVAQGYSAQAPAPYEPLFF